MVKGKLYLIPSLLSDDNPQAISQSTINVVSEINYFIVENEKSARHFLKATGRTLADIETKILDEHTPLSEISSLLLPVLNGANAGLISEAGAPAVADPGSELVRLAHEKNIEVIPLPGPSSILLALMASGLNGQQFRFHGYLPKEQSNRAKALKELARQATIKNETQIFIEAPYRNQHLLEDILKNLPGDLSLCIACELTSRHEFVKTKTIEQWRQQVPEINKRPTVFLLGR